MPRAGAILFHVEPGQRVARARTLATIVHSPGEEDGATDVLAPQAGYVFTRVRTARAAPATTSSSWSARCAAPRLKAGAARRIDPAMMKSRCAAAVRRYGKCHDDAFERDDLVVGLLTAA